MQGTKVIHTCMKICKYPVQYQNVALVLKPKIEYFLFQANSQILGKNFDGARLSYAQSKNWSVAAIAVGTMFFVMMVVVALLLLIIMNSD